MIRIRGGKELLAFKFSLQNVLDWREDLEDEAKLKLLQAKEQEQQEEQFLKQLIQENIQFKEKATLTKKIDAMRQQDLYKKVLDQKIVKQKLVLEQASEKTKQMEATLLKAHQDKRVMEKLKEKERDKYFEKINQEEQKQLDEFATISFGRESF